jgi:hypothetical protein
MTLRSGIVDMERGIVGFVTHGLGIWRHKMKVSAYLKLPFGLY